MTGTSWRERVKVHPAADLFPMMSQDELDALAKDIAEHGLRNSVIWFGDTPGSEPSLLDGRNRAAAIARIPDKERRAKLTQQLRAWGVYLPNHADPYAYVISANIHRRHLTAEQKREIVTSLLKAKPERSDRETAKIAKVSPTFVGRVRTAAEGAGMVSTVDTRTGADGVAQPARKPPKPPSKEAQIRALRERQAVPTPPPPPDDVDKLKQVLMVARGDPKRIANRSIEERVALARTCLAILRVTLDDLRDGAP
jgi:hypothetical protein